MPQAFILGESDQTQRVLSDIASSEGYGVTAVPTVSDARAALAGARSDVLLIHLNVMDGAGLGILDDLGVTPDSPVVLIGNHLDGDTAVEALRRGVTDYLPTPLDRGRLRAILAHAASGARPRGHADPPEQTGERTRFGGLIGRSKPMQRIYDMIERVAPTSATVIVTGESGTGKEAAARTIHEYSRRQGGPFEAINCGAISPQLFESELFGHERGSFTGADRRHKGCVERASRGTLLLDEITEMPAELQVKLLRILETGLFTRVGGETGIRMDARVIAATNRNVTQAVADGVLREDLYYRLKVFQIYLPPLRDRVDDIELLAEHFLDRLSATEGPRKRLDEEACEVLRRYSWPGNVRELRNVVHSASIMTRSEVIDASALPEEVRRSEPEREFGISKVSVLVGLPLAEVERRIILATLAHHGDNKARTAEALGISLKTLYTKLHRYQVMPSADGESGRS